MTQNCSLISTRRCTVAAPASVSDSNPQGNIGQADRHVAVHAECSTRVPMALGDLGETFAS
jgi:hypothetical protein